MFYDELMRQLSLSCLVKEQNLYFNLNFPVEKTCTCPQAETTVDYHLVLKQSPHSINPFSFSNITPLLNIFLYINDFKL